MDRRCRIESVPEIDRVLSDGGFLALGHSYPDSPSRRYNHHLPGQDQWTCKNAYPGMFLSSRLYRLIALLTRHQESPVERLQAGPDNRIGTAILKKEPPSGYLSV